ncbi:MAG: mechanosensitive ion channel family protein [Inconstantimicrobium porci]|uniref:mechanosensitive ion channel family protein n=1 Tax=Inconstantimicrobium porci TaxID=2652291 RepID=UPI002A91F7BB|nr:mechanosensitive ion channel family protein [Inconstantimicrobium porci]MDY5912670.1 mechanosensitive ion channel family protein [Inconstantimicrobium porci]
MGILGNIFSVDDKNEILRFGSYGVIKLETIYGLIGRLIAVAIIAVVMFAVIKIGNYAINRFVKRQSESQARFSMDTKKVTTIGAILKSVLKYTVYFIGIAAILDKLTGGMSLTFAGIGGAVIGFGAKDIVNDIANGFFIIFEDQFGVGDYITIDDNYSGIVSSIGLRSTKLVDFNGNTHIMPNGSIKVVTNHCKENVRITVDVDIAYEESIDKAIEVISKACDKFAKGNDDIIEKPAVLGVTKLNDSSVTIRVNGKVKPLTQLTNETRLRKMLKEALDENNVEIPYQKLHIVNFDNIEK